MLGIIGLYLKKHTPVIYTDPISKTRHLAVVMSVPVDAFRSPFEPSYRATDFVAYVEINTLERMNAKAKNLNVPLRTLSLPEETEFALIKLAMLGEAA